MINFIGIGAQKSGTSWVYACLYEHPDICAPIKEIHFFSRPRFEKGQKWYEDHFARCAKGLTSGEFSTSYLYSKEASPRIHALYPDAKLIAILRNPVDRAYSQYRNAIKAGEIPASLDFDSYAAQEPSVYEQGQYAAQLKRYLAHFPKEQILILIYEDSKKDPAAFIRRIYEFLGVDSSFSPSMLHTEINVARKPRFVGIDRIMHRSAEWLRRVGFGSLVWMVRKSGLPDLVRRSNTEPEKTTISPEMVVESGRFVKDTEELSGMIDRDMRHEWHI